MQVSTLHACQYKCSPKDLIVTKIQAIVHYVSDQQARSKLTIHMVIVVLAFLLDLF